MRLSTELKERVEIEYRTEGEGRRFNAEQDGKNMINSSAGRVQQRAPGELGGVLHQYTHHEVVAIG